MSFLKPEAPTPPSAQQTAIAQTGTNVSTAIANAFLGNVNQVTPTGSVSYNPTGSYAWTDPSTGQNYTIPTFTATQTLSPTQQAIQGQTEAAQYNLAGMANAQSGNIANLLSTQMDLSGAPSAGNAAAIGNVPGAATSYSQGGPITTNIGQLGNITQSYGPDNFSSDRQQVQDALMARMNPQLQIQQQQLQQQLANQGIKYGSTAYNNAMLTYNQQANDARWGAITQASQEQQNEVNMAAQQAAFQNAAQQQGYQQQLGASTFANQAQAQQYEQNAANAAFYNSGQAQNLAQAQDAFNAQQSARNQYMQEQYAQRNQPINEITSLLSGSQVTQPNFVNTAGSQIPTTDISGLINTQFNQQLANYQQQNNQYNAMVGGVLGLGAGALKASDEKVKKNITRLGSVLSLDPDHDDDSARADPDRDEPGFAQVFSAKKELPIYAYSYKGDPDEVRHVGPMAQDVEKLDEDAVKTIRGVKHIDTRKVMGNILRAA